MVNLSLSKYYKNGEIHRERFRIWLTDAKPFPVYFSGDGNSLTFFPPFVLCKFSVSTFLPNAMSNKWCHAVRRVNNVLHLGLSTNELKLSIIGRRQDWDAVNDVFYYFVLFCLDPSIISSTFYTHC